MRVRCEGPAGPFRVPAFPTGRTIVDKRNILYNAEHFIGESPEIKQVFETVQRAARRADTILLTGESGTGKDLIAGAIHYNGPTSDGPFVKVSCAGISVDDLDRQLFGDRPGTGRIEEAAGGTLYLDVVNEIALPLQEKLADRLIDNHVSSGGSTFRVIASTHLDLLHEVKQNRFRKDLYGELSGTIIRIPPLRERHGDVVLLTYFFLKKFYGDLEHKVKGINLLAIKYLTNYSWPGNVKELERTIKQAVKMARGNLITPVDLDIPFQEIADWKYDNLRIPISGIHLEEIEKHLILQALTMCDGQRDETAALLGLSMQSLRRRIRRHGISHPAWKRNWRLGRHRPPDS
jgi:DNA-binding NtrC family response regulator